MMTQKQWDQWKQALVRAPKENAVRAGMAGLLLLQAFPHVHFSYRLHRTSVEFFWTNGPTVKRVKELLVANGWSNGVYLNRKVNRRTTHLQLVK